MHPSDAVRQLHPDARILSSRPLQGGVSAVVHAVDAELDGSFRQFVVRGKPGAGRDVQLLNLLDLPVARALWHDADTVVLPFLAGTHTLPADGLQKMADALTRVHAHPTAGLPELPTRADLLPDAEGWCRDPHLLTLMASVGRFRGTPRLLHGDFWVNNLLWRDGALVAILDWEDAAIGDPLSDIAGARMELLWRFGADAVAAFDAQLPRQDPARLAAWTLYVATAAKTAMPAWGLPVEQEAHQQALCDVLIERAATRLATGG